MIKVFIGGSRRVTKLPPEVKDRLEQIIQKGLVVLVGDANGADKAIQKYLRDRNYDRVEVFCTGDYCRNNLGYWKVQTVAAPHSQRDFEFYEAKDRRMTEESSLGLMLWDGESRGTLSNVHRLLGLGKKVVLWIGPQKKFKTLRSLTDWEKTSQSNRRSREGSWTRDLSLE